MTKWDKLGEVHGFTVNKIPKELHTKFKKALKEIFGKLTMSDYLRIAVVADSRYPLNGKIMNQVDVNYRGIINWSKYKKFVKNPSKLYTVGTIVQYPKKEWEIFHQNCLIRGESPKHRIQIFMLELLMEYEKFKEQGL